MSVEDETFKVFFAFFGLARRASLDPPPSPLTLWLFFIDHPAPKARNTQSKLHATQKNSHAVTMIASAIHLSWFDNCSVTPCPAFARRRQTFGLSPALN
jgi:hypothetical protein